MRNMHIVLLALLALPAGVFGQAVPPIGPDSQLISLNFRDAPLEQVLDFYSELTGRTLIKMPDLAATITLRSQGRLSKAEALQAIDSILVMHNVALVPMGEQFLKVVQPGSVPQEGSPIRLTMPEEDFAAADTLLTQVIPLKHVRIEEVQPILQPMLQGYSQVQPLARSNSLLVTATSANIRRIVQLLDLVDRPDEPIESRVYELEYVQAADIAARIRELVDQSQETAQQAETGQPATAQRRGTPEPQRPPVPPQQTAPATDLVERGLISGRVGLVADERTNILFIYSRRENFVFFDRIVQVLDRPVEPELSVRVVRLEYADAEVIAEILGQFVGTSTTRRTTAGDRAGTQAQGGTDEAAIRARALRELAERQAAQRAGLGAEGQEMLGRLSEETRILSDQRTNSLVLMGRRQDLDALENVVGRLDVALAQVLIEAVIVEVNLDKNLQYGVDWLQRSMTAYRQEVGGPAGGVNVDRPIFSFAGGQRLQEGLAFQDASGLTGRDVPLAPGGLAYYMTMFDFNLDAVIRMAAASDDARILSTPVILTTDNTEARILVGEQRPVITSTSTTTAGETRSTYDYRDIGVNLTVTPRVNPDGYVVMQIHQTVDNVGSFEVIDGNRVPIITKRELEAQIAVGSQQTIVLGGLVSTDRRASRVKVPILGSIPILGALFRSDDRRDARRELLVLMTPYVMTDQQETREQTRRLHEASYSSDTEWHTDWSGSEFATPQGRGEPRLRIDGRRPSRPAGQEEPQPGARQPEWGVMQEVQRDPDGDLPSGDEADQPLPEEPPAAEVIILPREDAPQTDDWINAPIRRR